MLALEGTDSENRKADTLSLAVDFFHNGVVLSFSEVPLLPIKKHFKVIPVCVVPDPYAVSYKISPLLTVSV